MKTVLSHNRADVMGITGSVLCIIHCVATPVLVVTATWLQEGALRTAFEGMDYVFIGVNAIAVYLAARHSHQPFIRWLLWGFLSLFTVGLLLEDTDERFAYLAYAASVGLVLSHLANIQACRLHPHHPATTKTNAVP